MPERKTVVNKNPLSLSNKIRKVLEICRKINKKESHAEIIKYIRSRDPKSSVIQEFVFSREGEKVIISDQALKRIIRYCLNFRLMDEQYCLLTTDGKLATQSADSFREVLKGAIRKYLRERHNYELKELGAQIGNVLKSDSCKIPLPEQIWSLITSDMKVKNKTRKKEEQMKKIPIKFLKTVLNLLADCDYLNVYRKKIYTYPDSSQDRLIADVLEAD